MADVNDHDLLLRIDERTNTLNNKMEDMKAKMEEAQNKYVTIDEYIPVKNIVFGGTALVLIAFASAIIGLVIYQIK